MAFSIRITDGAAQDFYAAREWYREYSEETAKRFSYRYTELLKAVLFNPFQYPRVDGEARRVVFGQRFPYSLFFELQGEEIVVFSIFHHKRDPAAWQSRH